MLAVDWLLARRTVQEIESDTRRHPFLLKEVLDAVIMENMAATDLNRRFRAKSTNETNATVSIHVHIVKQLTFAILALFLLFLNAIFLQTRQAFFFFDKSTALVSTRFLLHARNFH